MQTGKGKAREYKVLLGSISVIVGLASFYVLAVSSYGILKGLVFGLIVSLLCWMSHYLNLNPLNILIYAFR